MPCERQLQHNLHKNKGSSEGDCHPSRYCLKSSLTPPFSRSEPCHSLNRGPPQSLPTPGPPLWSSLLPLCLGGHPIRSGTEVWGREWSKRIRMLFLKRKPKRVDLFLTFPPDNVQEFTARADLASNYLYKLISSGYSPPPSSLQQHWTFSPFFLFNSLSPPLALCTC